MGQNQPYSPPDEKTAALLLWMAEQRAKSDVFIKSDELAWLVELVGDEPLPGWLRTLVCQRLSGKGKRQGRPPQDNEWRDRLLHIAWSEYRWVLHVLQRRADRPKSATSRRRRSPAKRCFDRPPHELALDLIYKRYKRFDPFRPIDKRRCQNLLSSLHKKSKLVVKD